MPRRGALLLVALGACSYAAPLAAQALAGGAMAYSVTRRVSYQGTAHQQTGTWIGIEGSVRLGRVEIGATGLFGKVAGDSSPSTNPDLNVRVSDVWARLHAGPWIDVGLNAEARRQEADVGVTSWRLIGPTVRLTPGLGLGGLTGSVEMTYFVSASVTGGGESISPALRATLGATYAPPPGRIALDVSYRFERFDFAASGGNPARLEQFSGILAGIRLRLGRRV